jgi:glutamyl-tRNA reductase
MPIIVCGINHKTAPLALREKVAFALDKLALYLNDLIHNELAEAAVILSTCNRSEIYCSSNDAQSIVAWYCRQHQLDYADIQSSLYVYENDQAVTHIMQVACGIDSMVLGEPEILGQMKVAFTESCANGAVNSIFNRLFQQVFAVAKNIRSSTAVGACPVSVASAAVGLVKAVRTDYRNAKILVIGSGDTAELVIRHLIANAAQQIAIVNRNLENAATLAEKYNAHAVCMTQLTDALNYADIVITATGSPMPLVTHEMMQSLTTTKPKTMIDLAVPRDIEAEVADLVFVNLYCIDDLKQIIQHNLQGREHAAEKAQQVISQKSIEFMTWLKSFDLVSLTISSFRKQVEEICQMELVKAKRQLHKGEDPEQVLTSFAHLFTNKLLHSPSVQLRQAGVDGRLDILELAQQLFAIPQAEFIPLVPE